MAGQKRHELPGDLARAAARFAQWRQGRVLGERIPEPLWDLAVGLAVRHGISRASSALRLGYDSLKEHCEKESRPSDLDVEATASSAGFVELSPTALATPSECVIEFAKASGTKVRMYFKGHGVSDLAALARDFWEAG